MLRIALSFLPVAGAPADALATVLAQQSFGFLSNLVSSSFIPQGFFKQTAADGLRTSCLSIGYHVWPCRGELSTSEMDLEGCGCTLSMSLALDIFNIISVNRFHLNMIFYHTSIP